MLLSEFGEAKCSFPEPAVAGDRRVIAFGRPFVAHPAGALRILERVVERQDRDAFLARERVHELIQATDLGLGVRPAVVPGQDVREHDTEAQLSATLDHPAQIRGRGLNRPALGDVVDPALDDEYIGARRTALQPRRDLFSALAVDPVVPEFEPGVPQRRPVLPLAFGIVAKAAPLALGRVRIETRGACGDRVAERADDYRRQLIRGRSSCAARW